MNILIVEDDDALRETFAMYLEMIGHNPIMARGYVEAVKMLQTRPIHVAFVDYHLYDNDGLELRDYIQAHHPSTKVYIMSGNDGYDLQKPFELSDVDRLLLFV